MCGRSNVCAEGKLKLLKPVLREMYRRVAKVTTQVNHARAEWESFQNDLRQNQFDEHLREKVCRCIEESIKWLGLEENILAQKCKIEWLQLVGGNNSYFHASVKDKN